MFSLIPPQVLIIGAIVGAIAAFGAGAKVGSNWSNAEHAEELGQAYKKYDDLSEKTREQNRAIDQLHARSETAEAVAEVAKKLAETRNGNIDARLQKILNSKSKNCDEELRRQWENE